MMQMKSRENEHEEQQASLILNVDIFSDEFDDEIEEANQISNFAEVQHSGSPPESDTEGDPAFRMDLEEAMEETHIHQVKREFDSYMRTPFFRQFSIYKEVEPKRLPKANLQNSKPVNIVPTKAYLNNQGQKTQPKKPSKSDLMGFPEREGPVIQANQPKLFRQPEPKEQLREAKQSKHSREPKTLPAPSALRLKDTITKSRLAGQAGLKSQDKPAKSVLKKKTTTTAQDGLILERQRISPSTKHKALMSLTSDTGMDMSLAGRGNIKNNRLQLRKIWDKNE